jgi:hypothetical protein
MCGRRFLARDALPAHSLDMPTDHHTEAAKSLAALLTKLKERIAAEYMRRATELRK